MRRHAGILDGHDERDKDSYGSLSGSLLKTVNPPPLSAISPSAHQHCSDKGREVVALL